MAEALLAACNSGDLDAVKRILPQSLPEDQCITMKQHNGVCRPALIATSLIQASQGGALHKAAAKGHSKICEYLIEVMGAEELKATDEVGLWL